MQIKATLLWIEIFSCSVVLIVMKAHCILYRTIDLKTEDTMVKGARLGYWHLVTERDRPTLPISWLHACLPVGRKTLSRVGQGWWGDMTGNGTGSFHASKPSAPVNHPMKPPLIPRGCSLDETVQGWGQAFIHRLGTQRFLPMWAWPLVG